MTVYKFSALINNQHLAFDPAVDVLDFDSASISASAVTLTVVGNDLRFSYGAISFFLDATDLEDLAAADVTFANGSRLRLGDNTANPLRDYYGALSNDAAQTVALQAWGLGGADEVRTGSGADRLVGNGPLTPLEHVSRVGAIGSPNSTSHATVSADGRHVAFAGGWTEFGSTGNNGTDVFVKDMATGAVSNEHVDASGANGLSGSDLPVISADGSVLVFQSSSGLVPGTPPSGMLYLADVAGPGIQAVSTTTGNAEYANRSASLPDVSADGRYVVFSSSATNLAAGSTSTYEDVFLKDVVTGDVTRISTSITGGDGNGDSGYLGNAAYTGAKISADGRYVVFQSDATNLTAGPDTNGYPDIFLWDRSTGGLTNITAGLVAVSNPNNSNTRPDVAFDAGIGGYVVFETARNLVAADTSNGNDIYRYRISDGRVELVSSSAAGVVGNVSSGDASISGDGRFVVFTSFASNLVANDTNGTTADIFVKDMVTGAIALVSRSPAGLAADAASGSAQISLGGDWIVFASSASNLAATDGNASFTDVFRVSNPLLKDTLIGGAGNDVYVIDRADTIVESISGGTDTVQSSISTTLGANLENLTLTGTANLNGTGNVLNNVITGNAGSNKLNGAAGIDTVSYAPATAAVTVNLSLATVQATGFGSDTLTSFENIVGSGFNDRLAGSALANRLDGGLGGDTMTGGLGDDTYVANTNTDVVVEGAGAGTDTVISAVTWTLTSTLEHLALSGSTAINGAGNSAANVIVGNSAANTLNGINGNDTIAGGGGNDSLLGGAGADRLDGGLGSDTMVGDAGSDTYVADVNSDVVVETGTAVGEIDAVISYVTWTLGARLENLSLAGTGAINGTGNSVANAVTGNSAANALSGGSGNDTIAGGAGNDTIRGDAGVDLLTGSLGNDLFVLNSTVGSDVIGDFVTGIDDIQLSRGALPIGDGDLLVEGGVTRAARGGFANSAELVVFTSNIASLDTAAAAAAIGSANTAYTVGRSALFVVDNGTSSGVFRFQSLDTDALVEANELTLLATLTGASATVAGDYVFGP